MSSGQINEIENNLSVKRLNVEVVDFKTKSNCINTQQNVSSLDAYNKSMQCKNFKKAPLDYNDHEAIVAKRRLQKELKEFNLSSPAYISAYLKEDNFFEWEAIIQGPPGTSYEGGTFILDLIFPANYPFRPPKVTFKTKIYHCNINSEGYVSLDVLVSGWSPAMTLEKVLLSIQSLFTDCNPDDCLVPEIAAQYVNNREEHDRVCREWTKKYAIKEAEL